MHHRHIDNNDNIERNDRTGGIGHASQEHADIVKITQPRRIPRRFPRPLALLKTKELGAIDREKIIEHGQ